MNLNKIKTVIILILIPIAAHWVYLLNYPQVKTETKVVEKIVTQERRRVVTKVEEKPDGSKTTTIVEQSETKKDSKLQLSDISTPVKKNWIVGITGGARLDQINQPIYGAQVSRRIIGKLYVGGYARTDQELGLIIQFQF